MQPLGRHFYKIPIRGVVWFLLQNRTQRAVGGVGVGDCDQAAAYGPAFATCSDANLSMSEIDSVGKPG